MKKCLSVLVALCLVLSLVAGGVPGAAKAAPPATPMDIGTVTTVFEQESYTVNQNTLLNIKNTTTYEDMSGFGANIRVDAWIGFDPVLPAAITLHAKGNGTELGVTYTVPAGATGFWLSSLVPPGSARPPVSAESDRTEVFEVICDSMPAAFVGDPLTITAFAVAATADGFGDGTDQSNWTVLATDSTSVTVNGAAVLELSGVTDPVVAKADALCNEGVNGKATSNAALDAATAGLTPIAITLKNTGNATSEAIRIAPVGTSSQVQLWAKDTANDWWDINVSGWMPSAGITLPSGYTGTTNVYIISDQAGKYPMTVKVVKASDPTTVVTSAEGTLTVQDGAAPELTITGVQATPDEGEAETLPVTGTNNYWVVADPSDPTVYHLSFTSGSKLSEPVVTGEDGLVPVYLQPTAGQVTALTAYYTVRNEGAWLTYLLGTLDGTNPMAYIDATDFTAPVLLDAAQYALNGVETPMVIVDDYPLGTYALTGQLTDVDEGNTTTLSIYLSFTTELAITTESLDDAVAGKAYSATLEATGGVGTHTWALVEGDSLPDGLTLNAETGEIAGTPATPDTYAFTVTATDENDFVDTADLTLNVYEPLEVEAESLPDGVKNEAYPDGASVGMVTGGKEPYTFAIKTGTVPDGMGLGEADGGISGTPTATGTFNFTVTVTDSATPAQTVDIPCTIHVYESLAITTTSLPDGWVGTAYSAALAATGGTGAYTWTVTSGSLPLGLELADTGVITGIPTEADTFSATFQVTDTAVPANTREVTLSIRVYESTLSITSTSPLADGFVNRHYSEQLAAAGGNGSYVWSIASGTLPPGLSLSGTEPLRGYAVTNGVDAGVISGTPTTAGTYTFTVKVVSGDQAVLKQFTLTITQTWTLTLTVGEHGSVAQDPLPTGGNYEAGTVVTLTATPGDGYHVVWPENVTPDLTDPNKATVTMDADKTVTVTFAINTYTLTITKVGEGTISAVPAPTDGTYAYGTVVTLTATPATGYTFTGWSGDLTGTTNPATITMTGNKTVTVTFAINTYTLTITKVGEGTISAVPAPTDGTYAYGTVVTLTATPATGYTFTGWSGDLTGTTNPATITMTGNKTVTATFAINTYTLTITKVGEGTVTADPLPTEGKYAYGTEVTLTAEPAEGYYVTWTGATPSDDDPNVATVMITDDTTVVATFDNTYTITATAGTHGTIAPSGDVSVAYGADQSFTITPETGYHVADVLVDDESVGAVTSYTFENVTATHTISATFAINTYTITATAGTHGTIAPSGDVSVAYGADQSFTITPETGYHVADVLVDDESVGAVTSYTFENVTATHTISATFAINTYTLTITKVGEGTVTADPLPTEGKYAYGTEVTLTATPATGYTFTGWSGDLTGTTNPATIMMTGNKTVTATFAINTYTLTITKVGEGTVTADPLPTEGKYAYGTEVTLTATPATGYTFTGWSGDLTGTTNPATIMMTGNKTVTATFAINTFTVTVSVPNDHGTAVADKATYDYGDPAVITLTPDDGWTLNTIMDNGVDVTSQVVGNTYTIASVTANHTVTVTYKVATYVLTVNVAGSGTVAVSPNQPTYAYGTVVTLTATPATGYTFTGWSGDLTGTTNPATITMTGNKTVTATFAINTYTLTITKVGEGTISAVPAPTDGTYAYGTVVTLTATPATGYTFTGWSGDLTGTTNPATIMMTGNKTVTATFAINTYTVTVSVANDHGTAVADKASYSYGESAHVTLTAAAGYVLGTVTDNGTDVTAQVVGGVYTIASMTANHVVVATFVPVAVVPGDVDGDGHVTMLDALMAARAAVGITTLTGSAFTAADVNGDGSINMLDVLVIARMAVGIPG